jgi:hypothetical protein
MIADTFMIPEPRGHPKAGCKINAGCADCLIVETAI